MRAKSIIGEKPIGDPCGSGGLGPPWPGTAGSAAANLMETRPAGAGAASLTETRQAVNWAEHLLGHRRAGPLAAGAVPSDRASSLKFEETARRLVRSAPSRRLLGVIIADCIMSHTVQEADSVRARVPVAAAAPPWSRCIQSRPFGHGGNPASTPSSRDGALGAAGRSSALTA